MSAILEGKPDKNLILVTGGSATPKLAAEVAEQLGIDVLETTAYELRRRRNVRALHRIRAWRGRVRTAKPRSPDQPIDYGTAHHD